MGNIKKKPRLDYATIAIKFEHQSLIFDETQSLLFSVEIDSEKPIAAYGIQVSLIALEKRLFTTTDSEGNVTYHISKFRVWEKNFMPHYFADNMCPAGVTSVFVPLDLSQDMPRSISVGIIPFFSRLYYRLKAQLVPVDPDLVVDGDGKSMLRASETLIFQPKQSIAAAPIFNT